ncbi:peroxiredoxin [Heliophilum fasciatum]|nr:peroxiredoxin [Heliophilum fasciatum]MCW2277259.1 peroxiredoxin Q/BCP [Heliophilum fasciatum]
MADILAGQPAPLFTLPASDGSTVELAQLCGQYVVLYFYPKDNTPGCTLETRQFGELHEQFQAANAVILGISRDSIKSHQKFIEKLCTPFLLLSDSDSVVCTLYDVLKEKNMYGKKSIGVERTTVLIDPEGNVVQVWRKVKADGHAGAVLAALQSVTS